MRRPTRTSLPNFWLAPTSAPAPSQNSSAPKCPDRRRSWSCSTLRWRWAATDPDYWFGLAGAARADRHEARNSATRTRRITARRQPRRTARRFGEPHRATLASRVGRLVARGIRVETPLRCTRKRPLARAADRGRRAQCASTARLRMDRRLGVHQSHLARAQGARRSTPTDAVYGAPGLPGRLRLPTRSD